MHKNKPLDEFCLLRVETKHVRELKTRQFPNMAKNELFIDK